MTSKLTKNELVALNSALAAKNAALNAELLAARTTIEASKPAVHSAKEHAYASYDEAKAACLRLTKEMGSKYDFVQRGLCVICRLRVSRPRLAA